MMPPAHFLDRATSTSRWGTAPKLGARMEFGDVAETLRAVWSWWADALGPIERDESAWSRPTRLEGWDVAALTAHHAFLVQGLGVLAADPVQRPATVPSAEAMLRIFNNPAGAAATSADLVADIARQQAATTTPAQQVAVFRDAAPGVIQAIRSAGPVVVEYFGHGTFPLVEAGRIALMEGVVHGLDLAAALGTNRGSLPPRAVAASVTLLASIPNPLEFIEAATGRGTTPVLPVLR